MTRKTIQEQKEGKDRADIMLAHYKNGMTLLQVGRLFDLTRERIRQLLMIYHRDAYLALKEARYKKRVGFCLQCGKECTWRFPNAKYCSRECAIQRMKDRSLERLRKQMVEMKTKKCSTCGKVKEVSEFYPIYGKHFKDPFYAGIVVPHSLCKTCHKEKSYAWRVKNNKKKKQS
jgi:hypothetical protein